MGRVPVITTTTTTKATTTSTRVKTSATTTSTKKPVTVANVVSTTTCAPDAALSPCERTLRHLWAAEFRARAGEHKQLERLHLRGSRCVTHRCHRRVEKERADFSRKMRKDRAVRRAALRKQRCPKTTTAKPTTKAVTTKATTKAATTAKLTTVVATTKAAQVSTTKATQVSTTKATTATPAPTQLPTGNSCFDRQVRLNAQINSVLTAMNACTTSDCRAPLRAKSDELNSQLNDLGDCAGEETRKAVSTSVPDYVTPEDKEILSSIAAATKGQTSAAATKAAEVKTTAKPTATATLYSAVAGKSSSTSVSSSSSSSSSVSSSSSSSSTSSSASAAAAFVKKTLPPVSVGQVLMFSATTVRPSSVAAASVTVSVKTAVVANSAAVVDASSVKASAAKASTVSVVASSYRSAPASASSSSASSSSASSSSVSSSSSSAASAASSSAVLFSDAAAPRTPDEEEVDDELIAALTSVKDEPRTKAPATKAPVCSGPSDWNTNMAQFNKELARLNLAATRCDSQSCSKAVLRAMQTVRDDMAAFRKRCGGSVLSSAAKAAYDGIVSRYYKMLKSQLRQCSTVKCQRQFVRRYRIDLESRQIALFRQLSKQTSAKLKLDVKACNERADFTATMKETCVRLVTHEAKRRRAMLHKRRLRLVKRRDLRACDLTADPASCRKAVEAEFGDLLSKLQTVIGSNTTVASVARSASASASVLSVASILVVVLVIAAAF